MSRRRRMVLLAAGEVAAAVVLASVVVYVVTRDELLGQTDASLREKVTPGLPAAVQIRTDLSPAEVVQLSREGKLPTSCRRAAVEVRVRDGRLEVRDHGPGIARSLAPAAALQSV